MKATPGANIVMLASAVHSAFDTRIFHKEAKSLVKKGYAVSIIVPHEADVQQDQINIIAVDKPKNGFVKLIITPVKILQQALKQRKDAVYHVHDSELLVISILLKLSGRKVIYDAHEDTPKQMMYQHWLPKILRKPAGWYYYLLEHIAGKMFDAIVVAEPVLNKYYPAKKTTLVRNFPPVDKFTDLPIPYEKRNRWLVYIGLLSKPRGIMEMAEGAKMAKQRSSFEFVVGGKFAPPSLKNEYLENNVLRFLDWLSLDELVNVLKESQVGIIIPNPIERYLTNYPVKMFEYMAAGLPVIASKLGVSAEFVEECRGGILVDPTDPTDVANAIQWLFNHPEEAKEMGIRGREMVFSKYNWRIESEKLIALYSRLIPLQQT
jgi:glycosyltransferase involved in cell wall biosynthesis